MKWWIFAWCLWAQSLAFSGQDSGVRMRAGGEALARGLWEIAAMRFSECVADPATAPGDKSLAAIRLAESWIRLGNPADALELLGKSFVAPDGEALFWKAQALAGLGKSGEAIEILTKLLAGPDAPYPVETALTRASLQLSLGQTDAALSSLAALEVPEAKLRRVEILLDSGRIDEARETMPAMESVDAREHRLAEFLQARLLLADGKPDEAASAFAVLIDQPEGQSAERYQAAAIGLADALHARGEQANAVDSLLSFIQRNPDSPLLDSMFRRLLQWLPEKPAADDPVLERIAEWIPTANVPADTSITGNSPGAQGARPVTNSTDDLTANSLFTLALGLHRAGTPAALRESRILMTRLRLENPAHPLATRALLQTAKWLLDDANPDRAFALLDVLREQSKSPEIQGEATFLEARAAYAAGDMKVAGRLFDQASATLAGPAAKAARLNAAIIRLREGVTPVLADGTPPDPALAADLEFEQALSATPPAAARKAIEEFLTAHPDHPRAAEARLAAAEAALAGSPADPEFARAQLELLGQESGAGIAPAGPRATLISLRIADLANDPAATIAIARTILETYPSDAAAGEAAFTLGRNLFQTKSYNDARLVLEKLAASDPDPGRAQAAWLLAARSAALGSTPQSREDGIILYEKALTPDGPLAAAARMEKARHLIDLNRLPEASAFLRDWFKTLPEKDPLRIPAGILLGESLFGEGGSDAKAYVEALAIYDQLLAHPAVAPSIVHFLQYNRGMTLEQLPRTSVPTLKRLDEALDAYHSVLLAATITPPAEWEYIERCGFRALGILEKAGRWPAAIEVAKLIASLKGPRAAEAASRADQLQLKHMVWEN